MDAGKASKSDAPDAGNAAIDADGLLMGDATAVANVLPQEPPSNHVAFWELKV